ncbi:small, acid-soluble spore protein, alpha/beta type [Clostridium sp.]
MSHKDNKNSKDNKKANPKTKQELSKMKMETANEIGVSKESKKLGKDTN